jgi:DNA mismatch repair ATPase MutS
MASDGMSVTFDGHVRQMCCCHAPQFINKYVLGFPQSLGQLVMLCMLQRGVCPRSYDMECARSAGLPEHIIQHARIKSQEFESAQHHKHQPDAEVRDVKCEGKRAHTEDIADIATMRKVWRVLDLFTQSSQALQGKDILPVYRKLTEIWENLS